ncbi:CBS domain-containing protein [Salinibacillus xinjiangensis]|uniref:CBS domain-containing protein n=1 Tax=Salinibacillus xinjiangensis TaxID=1229268 RepID=A0A6G1X604_9BACI|nr:CBS domain-containing protein [Salinibacillus xinjiangensis]MRG86433.1 CBS domain-containing protein [Salinibacillus xinjiangensis]
MFVKGIMIPKHHCVITNSQESLHNVLDRLISKDIEAVPVVDDDEKFVGMITKQMIFQAFFEDGNGSSKQEFLQSKKVSDIVDHEDFHITEEDVFESTLTTFKGFPILAVIDHNQYFHGIVSRYDVLEQFESAFGMKKQGVRIAFSSIEAEGRISRLADLIKNFHGNIISLATFDETDKLARRIVLKIEKHEQIGKFTKKLEKAGFRVLDVKEI